MECKFCGAEVKLNYMCAYCGRVAEAHYYPGFVEIAGAELSNDESINLITAIPHQANNGIPQIINGHYTVISGDTLWNIAKRIYGKGSLYTLIVKANRGLIKNPNYITPGMCLKIPEIGSEGYG